MTSYDVFISYRRDGGAAEARLIQSALQARQVRAFLDVTELGRGYFDDALLKSIDQTPNFVVILSPHALDRAESDEDWLRKEIAHALKTDRNVVPLIMPGFQFPAKLPRDLKNLPRHQGMDYSHLYFDAMIQKLVATLDLSASDEQRTKQEQAVRDKEARDRAERAQLEEEREKLARARLSTERQRQENEARRKSLEIHQQEDLKRRDDAGRRRARDPAAGARWSGRFWLGDPAASTDVRQAALVSFWALLTVAFAFFATASGSAAQGGFAAGIAFLALAIWARVAPQRAAASGLVISGLTALGMVGVALSQRFDLGRMSLALYAGCAAASLWPLMRTARSSVAPSLAPWAADAAVPGASPAAVPPHAGDQPFGARFGDLIGVGERLDIPRLRLFIGARLVAGLAFWWAVQANQGIFSSFRVNYLWVIWVSAALPLALALTFRWLRNPPLSIAAGAVIASLVDPSFYQSGLATLTVAATVIGSFLFAAVIDEVDSTRAAVWLATVAANLGDVLVGWLWGQRFGGWNQAGANLYHFTLLCAVFTAAFVGGMMLSDRSKGIAPR
jgi:hypothetical protein